MFNRDPNGLYDSMPNASCVLDFVAKAASQHFPVLVAESLPRFVGGVDAASAWGSWFAPFFGTLLAQPAVKGFSQSKKNAPFLCAREKKKSPNEGTRWS